MERITPDPPRQADGWHCVKGADGLFRCSCGRVLVKMDENTFRCSAGFPIYRFDAGEVMIDKFGNLILAHKEHPNEDKDNTPEV